MQALAADTNAQQQTLVRLQKNTALACNDQLKELSTSLGHVRLQVLQPCLCCSVLAFLDWHSCSLSRQASCTFVVAGVASITATCPYDGGCSGVIKESPQAGRVIGENYGAGR